MSPVGLTQLAQVTGGTYLSDGRGNLFVKGHGFVPEAVVAARDRLQRSITRTVRAGRIAFVASAGLAAAGTLWWLDHHSPRKPAGLP